MRPPSIRVLKTRCGYSDEQNNETNKVDVANRKIHYEMHFENY